MIIGSFIKKEIGVYVTNLKYFVETGEKPKQMTRTATIRNGQSNNQQTDIFNSPSSQSTDLSDVFGSKNKSTNRQSSQMCKKCYGGLNDKGKCNQCDIKW